ncbi:hypothetical protein BH18ACT3_BH18ACT3_25800 [soil metagenome]
MRTVKHVLVVDDEPAIVEIVRDYLSDAGYRVSTAPSGDEALSQVRSIRPDLIVLDLGLPGLDGLDVARTIRQSLGVPIIMLTARSDEADRVVGLELGADDYLIKPFSPRELLARVRAVLRRSSGADEPDAEDRPLVVHELTVDPLRRLVTVGSTAIDVTATEFDLLAHMAAAPGRVFTRAQLLETITASQWTPASGRPTLTSRTCAARSRPTRIGPYAWSPSTASATGWPTRDRAARSGALAPQERRPRSARLAWSASTARGVLVAAPVPAHRPRRLRDLDRVRRAVRGVSQRWKPWS